jgi:SAM-dependent methyltransferase
MRYYRRSEIDDAMLDELAAYDAEVREMVGSGYRWPVRMRDWELAQILRAVDGTRPARVLETGACNTFLGLWLARRAGEVVVSDCFGARLRKNILRRVHLCPPKPTEAPFEAWWRVQRGRVRLRSVDLTRIPWPDGSFNLVTCVSVLEHIPAYERALAEMVRVLAPGGRLLLTTDVAPVAGPYQDHVRYFSPDELRIMTAPYNVTPPVTAPDFAQENWCYSRGRPVVNAFIEITKPGNRDAAPA